MQRTMGFPRMHKEEAERRDFTPSFFAQFLKEKEATIYVEKGYGSGMGLSEKAYLDANPNLVFCDYRTCYEQDIVVVLRAPETEQLQWMRPGAVLISMLHYNTRAARNELMESLGIVSFSMDSMENADGTRVVVNYYGTAMGGARAAYRAFKSKAPLTERDHPIKVTIMGMGQVGLSTARAFKDLSNYDMHMVDYPGMLVEFMTRSITGSETESLEELKQTDILVDATQRVDSSHYVLRNDQLTALPDQAVILDITADPYDLTIDPPQIKAIEGLPTGTLDKFVFAPGDPEWEAAVPDFVDSRIRRTTVSCNAWPGVEPQQSMEQYGRQMAPILKVLLEKEPQEVSVDAERYYEAALARSSYTYYKTYIEKKELA